jgi:signal transduction histidine kinase
MINDILDLAKLEAGKMELRPTEFRLDTVITAQCDMMRSLSEDKNIDLDVVVDPHAPPIYQDQSKVQQILTNLLSNAIKFTPEGGRITVRAIQTDDEQLELTVADTGVGIPEEDRDIIFEKFRQSKTVLGRDRLTREYSGTGLGLSIVKELCKLLGGEIAFTSELGKGSVFRVTLPWSLPNRSRIHSALNKLGEQPLVEARANSPNSAALAGTGDSGSE